MSNIRVATKKDKEPVPTPSMKEALTLLILAAGGQTEKIKTLESRVTVLKHENDELRRTVAEMTGPDKERVVDTTEETLEDTDG